jgi:predicted O-methyltransferase YrrM
LGNRLFPLWSFFNYWLKKEDKFSIHSPLLFKTYGELFDFILAKDQLDLDIEECRNSLLDSDEVIEVLDLGAGSKKVNTQKRKVSAITEYSTSSRKTSQLLQYFCSRTQAVQVIELGTCVGLNTKYLARETKGCLATFEGATELARIASLHLTDSSVELIVGNISDTLPEYLDRIDFVDFAFIDANHTYDSTLNSLKSLLQKVRSGSIIAIGDIHWSVQMQSAWNEIIEFQEVRLSLDFYEVGILFFEFPGDKEHWVLDF